MPRPALVVLSVFLFGSLSACKVSDDAIAASHQMTSTAAALNDFYSTLEDAVTDTITLYELDDALSGIPFRDNDLKLQETTPSDVDKSATALGNQLITIKALPSGSPVPGALGKAANALMQIVEQHDEKKAARAIDETLQAVGDLFEAEKPVYDSIARTHIRQAGEVAKTLIDANQVDYTSMLTPALKPFSLSELPSNATLQAQLKPLALSRLDTATGIAVHREEKASTAMLDALREMSSRVH